MKTYFALIIILCSLVGFAVDSHAAFLKIRIVDSATNEPLRDIGLRIENTGYGGVTDSNGSIKFDLQEIKKDSFCIGVYLYKHPDKTVCLNKANAKDTTITIPIALRQPSYHRKHRRRRSKRKLMNDLVFVDTLCDSISVHSALSPVPQARMML